jgi:hypothetical protein
MLFYIRCDILQVTNSVPQLFVIFCRNSGLRAVSIFRWWSKYIKNAKFCAEFNGCIGIFYKRWNHAAIQFLLICRPDEKKLARQSNQWHVLPFLYHTVEKISQNTADWFPAIFAFLEIVGNTGTILLTYFTGNQYTKWISSVCAIFDFLEIVGNVGTILPTHFTGNQYTKWISLVCAIFAFLEIIRNAGTTLLMYYTGNQYTKWKSLSSVCDLKIDHNCAR